METLSVANFSFENETYILSNNFRGSVANDSLMVTFQVQVLCHNVQVETYMCYLVVGNDVLTKTVDVVVQSKNPYVTIF